MTNDPTWRETITQATRARGYLARDPRLELTGQVFKLIEELCELADALGVTPQWALLPHIGMASRWIFDQPQMWQPADIGDGWQKELADVTVVLVNLVAMLEAATGGPVDLEQLAVDKATNDAARGVRNGG